MGRFLSLAPALRLYKSLESHGDLHEDLNNER